MTNRHKTAFYMDGHFKVEYCIVCSAEDLELQMPCCGQVKSKPRPITQREIDDQRDLLESYK